MSTIPPNETVSANRDEDASFTIDRPHLFHEIWHCKPSSDPYKLSESHHHQQHQLENYLGTYVLEESSVGLIIDESVMT